MSLKILFLLKKNLTSGGYAAVGKRSGLYNSANILSERLREHFGAQTRVRNVIDGNGVDKEIAEFRPDVCIIEALWVTPEKLKEVQRLHRRVVFLVRVHSEIPFLSNEGIAMDWIHRYAKIPRVTIAMNSEDGYRTLAALNHGLRVTYLPNIYENVFFERMCKKTFLKQLLHFGTFGSQPTRFKRDTIHIGCFGAIRPIKNQLIQATAAIQFANKYGLKLYFHMNGSRTEQGGESILKNLIALFENDEKHTLVLHPWMEREKFLEVVKAMDLGMQVSFNESFNIVAADFASQGVPVVVSNAIKWAPRELQVSPVESKDIVIKLGEAIRYKYLFKFLQVKALADYNQKAIKKWVNFFRN